jgi:hypothetical protein
LGIGDWVLGIGPNPQSPIPNPQSPIPNDYIYFYKPKIKKFNNHHIKIKKIKINKNSKKLIILII